MLIAVGAGWGNASLCFAAPLLESQGPLAPSPPGSRLEIPPAPPSKSSGDRSVLTLPPVFRGCWRGTVSSIDSLTILNAHAAMVRWLPKSYTFCYRRGGLQEQWELAFGEGKVTDSAMVSGQDQWVRVDSIGGPDRASLRAYLRFNTGSNSGDPSRKDEWTELDCRAEPDGSAMNVSARVNVQIDGVPSVLITWHARFRRAES